MQYGMCCKEPGAELQKDEWEKIDTVKNWGLSKTGINFKVNY